MFGSIGVGVTGASAQQYVITVGFNGFPSRPEISTACVSRQSARAFNQKIRHAVSPAVEVLPQRLRVAHQQRRDLMLRHPKARQHLHPVPLLRRGDHRDTLGHGMPSAQRAVTVV